MRIAVLSRNPSLYSTQRLLQVGRMRGHTMIVIDHMRCDLLIENDVAEVYFDNQKLQFIDAIIPRIGSSATYYGEAVLRHFKMMKVYTTLTGEALLHSRNKFRSQQILSAEGIRVPKTILINNPYTIESLLGKFGKPPYILKLLNSTHGAGVIKADDKQTAVAVAESFLRVRQRLVLQEFIAEAAGADIRVFVVDGEIVACMKRQAQSGDFRSNLHRGGTSYKIRLTDLEKEVALKATKILGLDVAGVDLLQTKNGPMVLEVNASPGLEGIEGTTGVNIAAKIIRLVESGFKATSYSLLK